MSEGGLRLGALREHLRGSLWFLPTVAVVVALVGGAALTRVAFEPEGLFADLVFGGGPAGARGVLETIAGSVITITSVTFSLTAVALTNASSQYSPRVLRTFLRDRGNQVVLATYLGTFAYCVVVLRTIRTGDDAAAAFVPRLALTGGLVLSLASLAALVYFIHHITQSLRVETILSSVQRETQEAAGRSQRGRRTDAAPPAPPAHAAPLHASGSGYLQATSPAALVAAARRCDAEVWYRRAPGEQVTEGTVLAWAWRSSGALSADDRAALERCAQSSVQLGNERTLASDVAFGLRQLVDIAVKALSPGVNDPTTAVDALGHLAVVLVDLASRPLGSAEHLDDDGRLRVGVPGPTFADHLALGCDQIARYGAGDLTVVRALLRLLEDVGSQVGDDARRAAVAERIGLVLERASRDLPFERERAAAAEAAEVARTALRGGAPVPASPVL